MGNETENIKIPSNAFLIVNGAEIFALTKPVVNIGRMGDNDLVLADTRISRYHAQLRAEGGHYIIVDLNSTWGTSVDGNTVSKTSLKPGNVITLAGIPMIYGQNARTDQLSDADNLHAAPSLRSRSPTITDSTEVGSDSFLGLFEEGEESNE
jgi:predicted component of type VI protein secretion system